MGVLERKEFAEALGRRSMSLTPNRCSFFRRRQPEQLPELADSLRGNGETVRLVTIGAAS